MTVSLFSRTARLVAITIPVLCSAQTYTVTDLGTLGGSDSIATAINASGEITGGATIGSGAYHAFLYAKGSMKDLGTLGGPSSQGQGINTSGAIVGYAQLPPIHVGGRPPFSFSSAFIDTNGSMAALGAPGGGAYGINDAGQVVGECLGAACLYSGGTTTNLGSLGGPATALAINSFGEVVGYSYLTDGNFRGFFWSNGKMTALGTFGGDWSEAYGINDAGQITGIASTPGSVGGHAFIYSNGVMQDLGTLGGAYSTGTAINHAGVVVGYATLANLNAPYHAFVSSGTKIHDLNGLIPRNSGWLLEAANGINDSGEIVGYGSINGQVHAFLLTPVK